MAFSEPTASPVDRTEVETTLLSNLVAALADDDIQFDVSNSSPSGAKQRVRSRASLRKRYAGKAKGGRKFRFVRRGKHLIFESAEEEAVVETAAKGLEGAIRRAIKGTVAGSGAKLALLDPAVLHIAEVVERSLPSVRDQRSEATIERLVDALVESQDPVTAVRAQIDARNAEARVAFMHEFATFSAEEVTTAAGSLARNRSQTASRWKAEGKIFSVPWQGYERFPAFQFKDGRPLPIIADILRALPAVMSPWETAFWFVSTNGWLDDDAPYARLADRAVVEAARREGEAVVG